MITTAILNLLINFIGLLISPINIVVDFFVGIDWVCDVLACIAYVLPWTTIISLILIVVSVQGIRTIIALIRFFKGFIPTLGG